MHQPGKRVPQVILATMAIGLTTTIPLFLVLLFCMDNLEGVIESPLPSLQIMLQRSAKMDGLPMLFPQN